ncbi:MAG TPA: Rrf2 family transcriptional regulator [Opitutaceae bacterium]|nr:Rrf2 family transcriptional regulator [Opitutaceae bacterium]
MKFSKKTEYALRAMIDLAIAHEVGRPLLGLSELAESERLPVKFLEQILKDLKQGGFVLGLRGKFGGYQLAEPAARIPVGRIVRHMAGPLAPIGCVSQTAYEKCSCPDEAHCGLRMLMLDVRNAITGILDRYTLADVVEVTLRKMRRNGVSLPFSNKSARTRSSPQRGRASASDTIIRDLLTDYSI